MTNTTRTIFNINYAGMLMKQGHRMIDTIPNPERPGYNMYIFEIDETFDADFDQIKKGGSRNGK